MNATAVQTPAETTERGQRKVRLGTVISDKMNQTIIVQIGTSKAHRLYRKTVRQRDFGVLASAPTTHEALPAAAVEPAATVEEAKPKRVRKKKEEAK